MTDLIVLSLLSIINISFLLFSLNTGRKINNNGMRYSAYVMLIIASLVSIPLWWTTINLLLEYLK